MSGGSYNYLCYAEAENILGKENDLSRMIDRLRELGYDDIAKDTESLLNRKKELQDTIDRLSNVWHAVEWVDSYDWGPEDIVKYVEEYRNLLKNK